VVRAAVLIPVALLGTVATSKKPEVESPSVVAKSDDGAVPRLGDSRARPVRRPPTSVASSPDSVIPAVPTRGANRRSRPKR